MFSVFCNIIFAFCLRVLVYRYISLSLVIYSHRILTSSFSCFPQSPVAKNKSPVAKNSGVRPLDFEKKIAPRSHLHYLHILPFLLSLFFSSLSSLLSSLSSLLFLPFFLLFLPFFSSFSFFSPSRNMKKLPGFGVCGYPKLGLTDDEVSSYHELGLSPW